MTENEHADETVEAARRAACRLARRFLDLVEDAIESECEEPGHGPRGGHGRPVKPILPGQAAPPVAVPATAVEQLTIAALGSAYTTAGQPSLAQVIWQDGDGEVLVHLDQTKVVLFPGLVLVALTLETDETGSGQLVVPFAVGSPSSPAGLLAVTEERPRGPAQLVDRWGQAAIAAAWLALLDVAHGLALQSGVDTDGARLIPAAITTNGSVLSVIPQARHPGDRVAGR
jgi:hypothetical protein